MRLREKGLGLRDKDLGFRVTLGRLRLDTGVLWHSSIVTVIFPFRNACPLFVRQISTEAPALSGQTVVPSPFNPHVEGFFRWVVSPKRPYIALT